MDDAVVAIETENEVLGRGRDRVGTSLLFHARGAGACDLVVGSGHYRSGVQGMFRSFREARWAAQVGYCLNGPNHVTDFGSLGAFAWLEPIDFDRGEEATHAIEEIMARDRHQGTRLLETLQTSLETRRLKDAADRLFIHRNTLRYRLDAIRKLTGLDVRDPSGRLVLELQMRLALVRRLIGDGVPQDLVAPPVGVVIDLVRDPSEDAALELSD
jgi:sugar diacid utilization regulator